MRYRGISENVSREKHYNFGHGIFRPIDLSLRFSFARFRSMIWHRRRHGMALVAVYQPAPATICAISTSLSGLPRWWPPRPAWVVPFGQVHLSVPPRVLVKGSWSSRSLPRVEVAAGAAGKLLRPVHPLGRSRISREYSQDGHLLMQYNSW